MFLPIVIVSSSASVVFGKDCLFSSLLFVLSFLLFCLLEKQCFCEGLKAVIYVAFLYAITRVFGITTGIFAGITSFVSCLFGRKGIFGACSIIASLSFVFLVLCVVFRGSAFGYTGNIRYIFPIASASACASCRWGVLKSLVPMFCGFIIGVIFGIYFGIYSEIFVTSSLFCTLSVLFSSVSVFNNRGKDTYNING